MRSEAERWTGALLHGWVEILTLFALLLVALLLIGWCWNRGLRPSDRQGLLNWPILLAGYALALVLRHFTEGLWPAILITAGAVLGGLLARANDRRGLWLPVMLLSALLGLGLNLSFVVLTLLIMLVLLLSAGRDR